MMCDKQHRSTEEALACRDKERLSAALERWSNIELALADVQRARERAVGLNEPRLLMDDEGLWDQVKRALES